MSDHKKKTIFPAFGLVSYRQPSATPPEITSRYHAFFGAIFNSLDSHFRLEYAQSCPDQSYSTHYQIKDDHFSFIIVVKQIPHDEENNPNKPAGDFFKSIYDIASDNELYQMSASYKHNPENGEGIYCLTVIAPLELMELMEHTLKPYDLDEHSWPSIRFSNAKTSQGVSFALFPQYAMQHIKALLHHAQGRNPEGHGPQLSH